MKFKQIILNVLKSVTLEPVILCNIMATQIAFLASQNLFIEKACRVNLQFSDEVCDALRERNTKLFAEKEMQVQMIVAGMQNWRIVIQSAVPTLMVLFWGSWSDRHSKRK